MIEIEPIDSLALTLHHSPGVQALLLGSGISRSAGVPTGWEITLDLIRRLASVQGGTDEVDWAEWYRKKYGKEPSYSEILDSVATAPAERRSIIHSYIEAAPGTDARQPTKAHHAIAQLVAKGSVKVILTTNFDRLLENALRDAGIEPTVIASDDAIVGAMPLVHSPCTIIKLHGDYMDARIKNTEDELQVYSNEMNKLLDRVLDEYGLVIAGWSGDWDPALRSAITRTKGRRFPLYWATRSSLSQLGRDLLDQRGGRLISIPDADSFFTQIAGKIDALEATNRPHPKSLELKLAEGKRLCRDDRLSLEWADLVASEVKTFSKFMIDSRFANQRLDKPQFNSALTDIVAKSETLRRLTLICFRWGNIESINFMLRVMQEITFSNINIDGITYIRGLNQLGAALTFHWGAAASIARNDFNILTRLLHFPIRRNNEAALPAVSLLPADALEYFNWEWVAGYEDRRTPHSDFIFNLLKNEVGDISILPDQVEDVWNKSELFITLESGYLSYIDERKLNLHWPKGRFIWAERGRRLNERLMEIKNLSSEAPQLKAGLLGGSTSSAIATIDAFNEMRQRYINR